MTSPDRTPEGTVTEPKPRAFIAHKDGYLGGMALASLSRKELKNFLVEFAAEGFSITPVYNREEYELFTGPMKFWSERGETR